MSPPIKIIFKVYLSIIYSFNLISQQSYVLFVNFLLIFHRSGIISDSSYYSELLSAQVVHHSPYYYHCTTLPILSVNLIRAATQFTDKAYEIHPNNRPGYVCSQCNLLHGNRKIERYINTETSVKRPKCVQAGVHNPQVPNMSVQNSTVN